MSNELGSIWTYFCLFSVKLYKKYIFQFQDVISEQRVACAAGLFSLAGSESTSCEDDLGLTSEGQGALKVTTVIQTATDTVSSHSDLGTHNVCSWLLGRLYSALQGSGSGNASGEYSRVADVVMLQVSKTG